MPHAKTTALDAMTDEELAERAELFGADEDGDGDEEDGSGIELLAIEERSDFDRYEKVIQNGLTSFIEVGNALIAIRDKRLYRATYGTFEQYCHDRWRIERRRAYQLMDAAGVVSNLTDDVKTFSHSESHVAPFAKLPPEERREAFEEGIKTAPNGKVTTAHMQKAAAKFAKPSPLKDRAEIKPLRQTSSLPAVEPTSPHYNAPTPEPPPADPAAEPSPEPLQELADAAYGHLADDGETVPATAALIYKREPTEAEVRRGMELAREFPPAQAPVIPSHLIEDGYEIIVSASTGQWTWAQQRPNATVKAGPFATAGEAIASAQKHYFVLRMPAQAPATPPAPEPEPPTSTSNDRPHVVQTLRPNVPMLVKAGFVLHDTDQGWRYFWPSKAGVRAEQYGPIRATEGEAIEDAIKALTPESPAPVRKPYRAEVGMGTEPTQPLTSDDVAELAANHPDMPDLADGVDRFAQYPIAGEPPDEHEVWEPVPDGEYSAGKLLVHVLAGRYVVATKAVHDDNGREYWNATSLPNEYRLCRRVSGEAVSA